MRASFDPLTYFVCNAVCGAPETDCPPAFLFSGGKSKRSVSAARFTLLFIIRRQPHNLAKEGPRPEPLLQSPPDFGAQALKFVLDRFKIRRSGYPVPRNWSRRK